MSLFQYIAQACQSLAATAAPSITAMGVHIVLALATIVMVWFGVQEALASAQGEAGFSMVELLVAMVITLMISGAIFGLLTGGQNAFRRETLKRNAL